MQAFVAQGIRAVKMDDISQELGISKRTLYELYDNKICTGEESAQCRACLEARVRAAGYEIVTDVGNVRR